MLVAVVIQTKWYLWEVAADRIAFYYSGYHAWWMGWF